MDDPMMLLTMGLVLFAGVQVIVMVRTENRARLERARDEAAERRRLEQDEDVAYQTCYAEHFRLWALGRRYRESDLLELSVLGLLRPDDVLPRDWGLMTQMLGRLSAEAGYLGATAVSLAHDLAAQIAVLNATTNTIADECGSADLRRRVAYVKSTHGSQLEERARGIRKGLDEIASLLWDAICHSGSGRRVRAMDFNDDLTSEMGKKVVAELIERTKTLSMPKDDDKAAAG